MCSRKEHNGKSAILQLRKNNNFYLKIQVKKTKPLAKGTCPGLRLSVLELPVSSSVSSFPGTEIQVTGTCISRTQLDGRTMVSGLQQEPQLGGLKEVGAGGCLREGGRLKDREVRMGPLEGSGTRAAPRL